MDANMMWIALVSIMTAGFVITIGSIAVEIAEGWAVRQALQSMAQQPDEAPNIRSTLFVSMAFLESCAIYCLLISMILIFANPFWNYAIQIAQAVA